MTNKIDSSKFIPVYRTQDEYEAYIIKSRLEADGFEARIHLDARAGYGLNVDPGDQIKVMVRASQAKKATDLLALVDFEETEE